MEEIKIIKVKEVNIQEEILFISGSIYLRRHGLAEWYVELVDVKNTDLLNRAFSRGDQLDLEFISEDGRVYRGKAFVAEITLDDINYYFKLVGSGVLHGA